MIRYIKLIFILILIFFSYCTFIWHYPKVAENIDFMLNTDLNEKLGMRLETYEAEVRNFGNKVKNWIDNPAPNTSSHIEGRLDSARNVE